MVTSGLLKGPHLSVALFSVGSNIVFLLFQSLLFRKVCERELTANGTYSEEKIEEMCAAGRSATNSRPVGADPVIQTAVNNVMLVASSALCSAGALSSYVNGKLGDARSRKLALLMPLGGLLLADLVYLYEVLVFEASPWWHVAGEAIWGASGGYMAVFAAAFALAASANATDEKARSRSIARLEGAIGFGGALGLLITSQIERIGYAPILSIAVLLHLGAFLAATQIHEPARKRAKREVRESKSVFDFSSWGSPLLFMLIGLFCVGFFVFIGNQEIQFFYLKSRFGWDAKLYSYLNAPHGMLATILAIFLYPWLRSRGFADWQLALWAYFMAAITKIWLVVAWSSVSVFFVLIPHAFSRFGPSAMRSLMSHRVPAERQGAMFAFVAVLEAVAHLLSTLFFHLLFPRTLRTFPQTAFVIMAVLHIPAIVCIWFTREQLQSTRGDEETEKDERLEQISK